MHIGLSVLLLAGFGVICILSGLWLGGRTVIGGFNIISLIKKKNSFISYSIELYLTSLQAPFLGNNITREVFSDFCENLSTIEENDASLDDQGMVVNKKIYKIFKFKAYSLCAHLIGALL